MADQIRDAIASDLPAIVEIYNAAIPGRMATADTESVSVDARREWFLRHDAARRPLWALEREDRLIAWLSFESFYGRPAYASTTELSVYVATGFQRVGAGSTLLKHAIERAPGLGIETLLAFIFGHNGPSLALFRHHGFEQWAHLPGVAVLDGVKRDLLILGRRVP
jgi:phosphinothricin acetyltransferase